MRKSINKEPVDIVIPTYDNLNQLQYCINSMYITVNNYPMRFIIVNNGRLPIRQYLPRNECFLIIDSPDNLGWTGGLAEGLKYSTSKYVMFANDDIFVPRSSYKWLASMTRILETLPNVAAVGPSTNVVMGRQNIWSNMQALYGCSNFLIGFCMLIRREYLDKIGGIDTNFQTGDDIDLSISFQKAGYHLFVDASTFIYHHGFQTGERIYGTPDRPGGWNSQKMIDDTNMALIRKHGFKEWWITMTGQYRGLPNVYGNEEIDIIYKHLNGEKPNEVLEVGCGHKKFIDGSIGIDIIPKGERIWHSGLPSAADITADVEKELPFKDKQFKLIIASHIIEHCLDTLQVFGYWKRVLTDDGKIIICCPDDDKVDTIIMNPEHCHAFTKDSLGNLADRAGLNVMAVENNYNDTSFTMVLGKGG